MLHPDDHAAYLARHDFPVPAGAFTPPEADLLGKYGRWLDALASGALEPTTPGQERFVHFARDGGEPTTDFERVWAKWLKEMAVAEVVAQTFEALREAKAHASEVEAEYLAARQVVLASVREQLDAVDATFAEQMQAANAGASEAEKAARELVLKLGRSATSAGVKVTYNTGRVTWDTEKMAAFAEAHPEVQQFRKVGKPWVALHFTGDGKAVNEEGERG